MASKKLPLYLLSLTALVHLSSANRVAGCSAEIGSYFFNLNPLRRE